MRKSKNRYYYHILFPLGTPVGAITLNVVWMERKVDAYKLARSMYPSIFNSFPVIRTANAKKNFTYSSPHFCFTWRRPCDYHALCCMDGKTIQCRGRPGAITLNVVWMEREFDAYKLSRWMRPSNYNRFWDRPRYWSKIVDFSYPLLFDAPVRGVPVGISPPRLVWKN